MKNERCNSKLVLFYKSRAHNRKNSPGNINIADGLTDESDSKIRYLPLRFVSIVVLFLEEKSQ